MPENQLPHWFDFTFVVFLLLTRGETSHGDTEDTEQVANPEEIDIDEDEDEDDNEEGA